MMEFLFVSFAVATIYLLALQNESHSDHPSFNWEGIYPMGAGYTLELERTPQGTMVLNLDSPFEHASYEVQAVSTGKIVELQINTLQTPRVGLSHKQKGIGVSDRFLKAHLAIQKVGGIKNERILLENLRRYSA